VPGPAVLCSMTAPTADLSKQLDEIVERGEFVVPPYPAAAMRLRSLIESDKFVLSQIADAASADAALAAALLRIANSPVYRGDGPPHTTLMRAVNRLGARAVSSLALAAGIGTSATSPGPLADVKYRVWRRSITCALGAQRFGPARGIDAEGAFLSGLLYGFGRSVALACIEKLIAKQPEEHTLPEWLELVEQHRARLAERVAQLWQLPAATAAVMSDGNASSPGGALVAFADRIAGGLERGANAAELAAELGLDPPLAVQLERFITHLPGALEAFIQTPDVPKRADAAKKARVVSAVTKPDSLLPGELHSLLTPVLDLRKVRTPEPFQSIGIAPLGLVINSARPLQESSVIRLGIQTQPTPIEAWFNVVLCVPEGQRFRIELLAFAASSDLREQMGQLWATAAPLGRTSLGPTG
jgi:HD-like signal output (HDOD) protein